MVDKNTYRILKTWDDAKADWSYCLEIDSHDGKGWQDTVYHGDGAWAIRESEHYRCQIAEMSIQ